jgi:cyclopropane fatty-acyl-phospholipid synthase-like methyltransferase
MEENIDLAGKAFWESQWSEAAAINLINVSDSSVRNHQRRKLHEKFQELFLGMEPRNKQLLEIGCAHSIWLPYFAKEFGFNIAGLDYSETGCAAERRLLANINTEGEIICADFFAPPEQYHEKYDVLVSFGVVEHFTDTVDCLSAFSQFLKPGGLIITLIPNMVGIIGQIAKVINRPFYDLHVLLSAKTLAKSHLRAGFTHVQSDYFTSANFGILNNFAGIKKGTVKWALNKAILFGLLGTTVFTWLIEDSLGDFNPTQTFSPYIICTGRKD